MVQTPEEANFALSVGIAKMTKHEFELTGVNEDTSMERLAKEIDEKKRVHLLVPHRAISNCPAGCNLKADDVIIRDGEYSSKDECPLWLWHYTDEQGFRGILQSGQIRASSANAKFGPGIYLTQLCPHNSAEDLRQNNYDGFDAPIEKTRFFFAVPSLEFENKLEWIPRKKRNLWLHRREEPLCLHGNVAAFGYIEADGTVNMFVCEWRLCFKKATHGWGTGWRNDLAMGPESTLPYWLFLPFETLWYLEHVQGCWGRIPASLFTSPTSFVTILARVCLKKTLENTSDGEDPVSNVSRRLELLTEVGHIHARETLIHLIRRWVK